MPKTRDTKKIRDKIDKRIQRVGAEWMDKQVARLGNFARTVQVPNKLGVYYARLGNGKVIEVHHTTGTPPTFDLRVEIARARNVPTVWQILRIADDYDTPATSGEIAYHNLQHQFGHGDMVPIHRKQIMQLTVLVYNSESFIVAVYGDIAVTPSGFVQINHQNLDLSGEIPETGAIYVSIEADVDGVLSLHAGDDFGSPEAATPAFIPIPSSGKVLLAFVLLYDGQTALLNEHIHVPMILGSLITDGLYVDLTTNQTVAGIKRFSDSIQVGLDPVVPGGDGDISQTSEGKSTGHLLWTFTDEGEFSSYITGLLANGTRDVPLAVLADQIMMIVRGRAYNGSTFPPSNISIKYVADEDQGEYGEGTRMEFWVTPLGEFEEVLALTIRSDGNIDIPAGKSYMVNGVPLDDGTPELPTGGTTGQVLKKASGTDYDVVWDDDETGGFGTDPTAFHSDEDDEFSALTEETTPVAGDWLVLEKGDSSGKRKLDIDNLPGGAGGDAEHGYYQYLAALLEPDAIESLLGGTFSYAVNGSTTKLLTASWSTKLGSAGRMEVRIPRDWVALRGVTLSNIAANGCAIIIDPSLPDYGGASREVYFDRMKTIVETTPKYLSIVSGQVQPFLTGAYGAIVLHATQYNFAWISIRTNGDVYGWNLAEEINDSSAFRTSAGMHLAVNKKVACEFRGESGSDTGETRGGSLVYFLCPSDWSVITDPNMYDFRDDFMASALDTAVKWATPTQSTAGNIEINTLYQWLKIVGTSTWGANGLHSQYNVARTANKVLVLDVYTGTTGNSHTANGLIVGWHDGSGDSYTDFAHGLIFTSDGGAARLQVYENGNNRGYVGNNPGYAIGTVYRVRITLDVAGSNTAKYEIQGGVYGSLGSNSWTDITPGTTSSSTTPLHVGAAIGQTNTFYISDVRVLA